MYRDTYYKNYSMAVSEIRATVLHVVYQFFFTALLIITRRHKVCRRTFITQIWTARSSSKVKFHEWFIISYNRTVPSCWCTDSAIRIEIHDLIVSYGSITKTWTSLSLDSKLHQHIFLYSLDCMIYVVADFYIE